MGAFYFVNFSLGVEGRSPRTRPKPRLGIECYTYK